MRRLSLLLGPVLVAGLVFPAAAGGKSLAPTVVTFNADGSATFTTAAPRRVERYCSGFNGCNLRVYNAEGHAGLYPVFGDGSTVTLVREQTMYWVSCPCVAEFWAHGGQWYAYSAPSDPFTVP